MKKIKYIISITLAIILIIGVYIAIKRPDIKYGIMTLFDKRESITLEEVDIGTQKVDLSDIEEGKYNNIKYTNNMWLVNNDNKLDYNNNLNLVEFRDTGFLINREVVEPLESLLKASKEYTEDKLLIMSTYRDKNEQEDLYKEDSSLAAKVGYSEHETGLALDLYVHTLAQKNFIKSQVGKWVNSNAHKYGFITRYPFLGKSKTGFNYEPWHIRYVGLPHSNIIYNNRLTLEEYYHLYEKDKSYKCGEYIISYQSSQNNSLDIPKEYKNIEISKDNKGGYIITSKIK
ncbi:M15 family metallopeptidase [Clostridium paraputrificum]|uniref:M15 family metallopeptidase n=1 Tax=Clostridium paraputrificum TaxID=29363 RepID=UPI00233129F8|nr:M15 family metallopeptidase [Clostridium paraputrificum]MDB2074240.1 M15 family metallopeptidase [Clostridium paraputrificum]MDB2077907.1 M15 family metallopeptidase [Clostridium paraputrificum]